MAARKSEEIESPHGATFRRRSSIAEDRVWAVDVRRGVFALYVVTVSLALLLPLSDVIAWITGLVHLPASSGMDKYVHITLFAGLTFLYRWSARGPWTRRSTVGLLLLALVFGAIIEVVQGWTGYRTAEWTDLACDGVGAAAGLVLGAVVLRRGR